MSKQRRTLTPALKREAASLVLDQDYSRIEAARSPGLVELIPRRWGRQGWSNYIFGSQGRKAEKGGTASTLLE